MNDQARQQLKDTIARHGAAACNTPRVCAIFIRQGCPDHQPETDLFVKALDCELVRELSHGRTSLDELAGKFAEAASIPLEDARWTMESWALALGIQPGSVTGPAPAPELPLEPEPPAGGGKSMASVVGPSLKVAAAGALGAGFTGIVIGVVLGLTAVPVAGKTKERDTLLLVVVCLIYGIAGALAGGIGSGVGWLLIQMQSSHGVVDPEVARRRLVRGIIGALSGAFSGGAMLGYCFGPVGLFIGSLIGGFTGAAGAGMSG